MDEYTRVVGGAWSGEAPRGWCGGGADGLARVGWRRRGVWVPSFRDVVLTHTLASIPIRCWDKKNSIGKRKPPARRCRRLFEVAVRFPCRGALEKGDPQAGYAATRWRLQKSILEAERFEAASVAEKHGRSTTRKRGTHSSDVDSDTGVTVTIFCMDGITSDEAGSAPRMVHRPPGRRCHRSSSPEKVLESLLSAGPGEGELLHRISTLPTHSLSHTRIVSLCFDIVDTSKRCKTTSTRPT